MKPCRIILAALVTAACYASGASAATLSLAPSSVSARPGDIVTLNLVIDGLGNLSAPAVGDFEVDIDFDPGSLGFIGYSLGQMLGDTGLLEAFDASFGLVAPGTLNIAEVSLLTDSELTAMQPDAFILASIEFLISGLAPGLSTSVNITSVPALGDVAGAPITVEGVSGATINSVPLPAAVWLLGTALLAIRRVPGGPRRLPCYAAPRPAAPNPRYRSSR